MIQSNDYDLYLPSEKNINVQVYSYSYLKNERNRRKEKEGKRGEEPGEREGRVKQELLCDYLTDFPFFEFLCN